MANCKICGRPVISGHAAHVECIDRASQELMERFCDDCCRWPRECTSSEDLLELHCGHCPMEQLAELVR